MRNKDKKDQYRYIVEDITFTIYGVLPGISKFNIGDMVRITDSGELYTTYSQMVKAMYLDHDKWLACRMSKMTDLEGWTVAGIKYHNGSEAILCGIVKDTRVFIIGEIGLEIMYSKFLTDDLFDI